LSLNIYNDTSFTVATQVDKVDLATGDGVTNTFPLTNLTGLEVGSTITVGSQQYYRYNGGFAISGDNVVFSVTPPANTQIVIPGVSQLIMNAFDTDDIEDVDSPRVKEIRAYVVDVTEIGSYSYEAMPGLDGVRLVYTDLVSSSGATLAYVQLACSNATGGPGSYAATGDPLYLPPITAWGTLATSYAQSGTPITVAVANSSANGPFYVNDYAVINAGGSSQEVTQITAVSGSSITITGTNYPHYTDETFSRAGQSFWIKLTVPEGAAGGQAVNLYDLGLRVTAKQVSKL
jgi:hypothetical protein